MPNSHGGHGGSTARSRLIGNNTAKGGEVFVSPDTRAEELFNQQPWAVPRPTDAWRSAVARQRNFRTAITFWTFNVLVVAYHLLKLAWSALRHTW
jgi:hypothetical protein